MGQYSFEWLCDYESNNLPYLYDPVELPPNQIMYKLRTCKLFLEWSFLISNKVNLLSQVYSAISGKSVTLEEFYIFLFQDKISVIEVAFEAEGSIGQAFGANACLCKMQWVRLLLSFFIKATNTDVLQRIIYAHICT